MRIGEPVDKLVGVFSRLLHGFRGAHFDTTGDLGPYLDAPIETMFPAPVVPRDVVRKRPLFHAPTRIIETLTWHSQHVALCPHYRARHAGEYGKNQLVTARYMHGLQGERKRAIIYVHGWLEPGPWVEEAALLPRLSDDLDVDVLHLQLPFHGSRNPRTALFHGEFFWSADLVRSLEAVRQSVLDVRTLIAWLRSRGYIEIGVTGLSLGGAITMILACVEPLPDYIVPVIAHLRLREAVEEASILWRMKQDLERFGLDARARRDLFGRLGIDTMRPLLPPDRQLWVMAREDQYIKADLVEEQWRAWGSPPIEWLKGGHMTFPFEANRFVNRLKAFHATLRPVISAARISSPP